VTDPPAAGPPSEAASVGTWGWTSAALCAFAANSLLCRGALRHGLIDPIDFTVLRIAAGAAVLLPLSCLAGAKGRDASKDGTIGSWISAAALVTYAVAFSWAYTTLATGTGALIAFASVQVTMIGAAVAGGDRLPARAWLGASLAVAGLVYLLSPGLTAPDLRGALSMATAGAAWGVYSLRGRKVRQPLRAAASSFGRGVVLVLAVAALALAVAGAASAHLSWRGAALALISGGVTSGLGYAVWYRALRGLRASTAALVQLAVPVITAFAGALLLGESMTARLVIASAVVLAGLALALAPRVPARSAPAR
jgi:drug/metabolite transporter (DMT)-like permease